MLARRESGPNRSVSSARRVAVPRGSTRAGAAPHSRTFRRWPLSNRINPGLQLGRISPALLLAIAVCGCAHKSPRVEAPTPPSPTTAVSTPGVSIPDQSTNAEELSNWRQFQPVPELSIPVPEGPLVPERRIIVPRREDLGESLVVLPGARGAIGSDTLYPSTPPGLLNPATGQIYPRIGQGFINPSTGQYFRAPAGSARIPR